MAQKITMQDVLDKEKDSIMVDEKNRLNSFKKWKYKQGSCTKENMAKAGFYMTGEKDMVRCYVCFKELESWEPDDDPIEEHISHSPNCELAKILHQVKTQKSVFTVGNYLKIMQARSTNLHACRLKSKLNSLERSIKRMNDLIQNIGAPQQNEDAQ